MARWGKEKVVVLKVRSLDQHHLETGKCRFLGPTPDQLKENLGVGAVFCVNMPSSKSDGHPNSRTKE